MSDPTQRFTDRVDWYVRHRPGYPEEVVSILRPAIGLDVGSAIVDLGCGTGISSELFLRHGYRVTGVEPNREMANAAETLVTRFPLFSLVRAPAEATTLPDATADCVVAAQSFHWFDRERVTAECARLLRPGGWLVLLWNRRRVDGSELLVAYEALLKRYGTDYSAVDHRRVDASVLQTIFSGGRYTTRVMPNHQSLDREGLRGRLLSSSYVPPPGSPDHAPMLAALDRLFASCQRDGRVRIDYDTEMHYGHVAV